MRIALASLAVALASFASCIPEEGFWPDDPPRDSNRPPCSEAEPLGACGSGETCRGGQCLQDELFCSGENPTGLCPRLDDACLEGTCVPAKDLCADDNLDGLCPQGLSCHEGFCATDQPCAPEEPLGFCDSGRACLEGTCVDRALLCDADTPTGLCRSGTTCIQGSCVNDNLVCSVARPSGLCQAGARCVGGACRQEAELCSPANQTGACDLGEICVLGTCTDSSQACGCTSTQTCVDGICRDPAQLCSRDNPSGVCANGGSCIAGRCEDLGAACSQQNLTGVCPPGELCESGSCRAVDGAALCDDNNPCTTDLFDPIRNRCRNDPREGSCEDGNACTVDACVEGQCVGAPIGGCIEPPGLEPIASPTNVGSLVLRGTKPAGASVHVNNLEAVPENPDSTWQVTVNLVPGPNRYVIKSVDGAVQSASREIVVVYDITPPVTRVTPDGGSFLSGVTATLASNEPATVFFTTDGSEPNETSASFASLKHLRIFSDTHLRLRARDLAGNLEASIVDVRFEVSGRGSAWQLGPTLAEGLSLAAATTTGDDVFVVGGTDGLAPQAGAYAYSISADTFTTLPSMPGARDSLALVALGSSIFAIGGQNAGTPLNRVEVLDDGAANWIVRAAMPSTRHSLAAVAVNGRIFVFGGRSNGDATLTNVEVYDPAANSWSNAVAQMPRARASFGAALVDGLVYLVGGIGGNGQPVREVDVYDPAEDTWSTRAALPTPRSALGVTVVENLGVITSGPKSIVASGGLLLGGVPTAIVEEYIIDDDAWVARAALPAARHSAAAVSVAVFGDVDDIEPEGWLIGGQEGDVIVASTRALRIERDYARRMPDLPAGRFLHGAAALDDRIYVFGGRNFSEETTGWAFDPETGSYEELPPLPSVQNGLGAVAVGDRVYAIGGTNGFGVAVATTRGYDPVERRWVGLRPMTSARSDVAITAVGNDVYVIGGENGGALQTVEIYDVARDEWRTGPLLPVPRKGAMALTHQGKVFVLGGERAPGEIESTVLRLDGGSWTALAGSLPVSYGSAFSLHGRFAVFAGRKNSVIGKDVLDYDVGTQSVLVPRRAEALLHAAVDRRAAALHNGRIYFFGGNENEPIGPSGVSRVEELDARCFNGVRDGRENDLFLADSGGGCPEAGFVHRTGTGITFINDRPSNTSSIQGAIDACNAHFGIGSCAQACGGSCTTVTRNGNCSCSEPFTWHYGSSSCFGTGAAGLVTQNVGGSCRNGSVGNWD
jgi:N-acetylneuraminic acid mutarotase